MERDVKEIVGVLMRVLGGGTTSRVEVEDLAFEASGNLQVALNEAFGKLLEVGYDHDAGLVVLDEENRAELQRLLDDIVRLSDDSTSEG